MRFDYLYQVITWSESEMSDSTFCDLTQLVTRPVDDLLPVQHCN
jgi:hypothetical protein